MGTPQISSANFLATKSGCSPEDFAAKWATAGYAKRAFRLGFWGVPNKRSPVHCRGPVLAKWCNPPRWVGTVLFLAPSHKARPSIRTTGRQPDFPPGKAGSATTVARRSLFRPRIDPPVFLIGWPPRFFNFRPPMRRRRFRGVTLLRGTLYAATKNENGRHH